MCSNQSTNNIIIDEKEKGRVMRRLYSYAVIQQACSLLHFTFIYTHQVPNQNYEFLTFSSSLLSRFLNTK